MVEPVKKGFFGIGHSKPKAAKKVSFFRLMAITQKAGLGIRESLITLRKSENQKNMQVILDDIIMRINQGMNISSALEAHSYFFSFQEIQLIKSSEAMGNLPETLNNIATESENHQKLIGKIKGAMTYPIVILVMSFIASIAIITFVIPGIVKFFPTDVELPF
ncbi:MAG: type II secretion system F family protein, partial [Candidatus Absconditabacteria bacterium]